MARVALLVLAALLFGACRPAPDGEGVSPDESLANTEHDGQSSSSHPSTTGATKRSGGPSNSLIAVATTSASEAGPCERVCGSLGDCLLADEGYASTAATGLELSCLDNCVHSPDTEPVKAEFLACGSNTECGPLRACAERSWDALAATRKGPELADVVAATSDPCKNACRWMFSCIYTNMPPGEAYLDPSAEQSMNLCVDQCDHISEADREYYIKIGECLPTRCSIERYGECFYY